MYQISELTEDNIEFYTDYVGMDMADNIGRTYYSGLIASSDNLPVSAIVWELKNKESDKDTESLISWIRVDDEGAFPELMAAYRERMLLSDVKKSTAVIPVRDGKHIRGILKDEGFNLRLTESDMMHVKLYELSGMPFIQKLKKLKLPDNIMPLNQITVRSFRKGIAKCLMGKNHGMCEDLVDLGIQWFENDVSCVSVADNGINGFLLFHARPSGVIEIQLMIAMDKEPQKILPYLMRCFVDEMEKKYEPDTQVAFDRNNPQMLLLMEKLLPRGIGIPVYAGSRTE
ncbi:MAG: hypothetical protein J6N76_01925 [Lachnospiraceae bacterium]|nr:hypothetical protein [Lachnospiraceae bacterium]